MPWSLVRLGLEPTRAAPPRVILDQAPRQNRLSLRDLAKAVSGGILKVIPEAILEGILEGILEVIQGAGSRRDMVAMVAVIRVKITVMEQQGVIIAEELPKAAVEVIFQKEIVNRGTLLLHPRG